MSDEYIGRETLLQSVFGMMDNAGKESIGKDDLQYAINKQDAADVAPIVHGEWREDTDPADGDLRCTHCGIAWPKCVQKQIEEQGIWTLQTLFKYCPNCGAKMDKEAENERND